MSDGIPRPGEVGEATTARHLVRALADAGVEYLFANFGSDHPAIIEALAAAREAGEATPVVVLCPHEYVAMSAAHGYAAATGRAQAVFVHTDVGTANLGGSVHNAFRSRVPVFVFAGLTPFTIAGELAGTRNTAINHLQDAPDQPALVRQYSKWQTDVRTGRNVPQLVARGLQLATSAPAGPVYLTGAREALAETVPAARIDPGRWRPIVPATVGSTTLDAFARDLDAAERPVLVTSYAGRDPEAPELLAWFAETFAVPVVEHYPERVNLASDHPLHAGDDPHPLLAEADLVIALDTEAPWLCVKGAPRDDARIWVVNEDPLEQAIPVWYAPADYHVRASARGLLAPLRAAGEALREQHPVRHAARSAWAAQWHARFEDAVAAASAALAEPDALSAALVAHTVAELVDDDAIVVDESITSTADVWRHLPRRRAGTRINNGGTSLGWSGGGALGVKLAHPDRTVVSLVGDGTFFFSVPSSSFWVAAQYGLATLTIVLDNGGWGATKRNLLLQHRGGVADATDSSFTNLGQSADYAGIAAAAGGAWGSTVTTVSELRSTLTEALATVAAGTPAVVTVRLPAISQQQPDAIG